jgi:hypothetical protein
MKTGVIIYVAGIAPGYWTEKDEVAIRDSESNADLIEVITTETGHFDVLDAWRHLVAKGMSQVICKMAFFSESGVIEYTGKRLRLCG